MPTSGNPPPEQARAFSKCKSYPGKKGDEEQKMFTSQKNSVPVERSVTPLGSATLNEAYIIVRGLLLERTAYRSAIAAVARAVP
jgi:hypothetical protein